MINWKSPYNSTEWIKLREKHLQKQPYCVKCDTTLNLQVDHVISHRNNIDLFLNPDNLQTLCIYHHSEKTNQTKSLISFKRSDKVLKIKLRQNNGINLEYTQFVKLLAHKFVEYSTHYELNIMQADLTFQHKQTLTEIVLEFFKIVKLVCLSVECSNSEIVQLFKELLVV